MDVRKMRNELLGKRLVAALESRNMEAYYVETKEEAVKKALELIPKGSSINMGGATSVKECGLYEALSNGEYQFYDRDKVSTQEEKQEIALKAFTSDYFLGSVNAMSEDGVFINIDGNANRVAAYAYGPKHVLLIVGMNKVVKTEADAMSRARNEAAPINAQRFGIDTPCTKNGTCFDCKSPQCICCQILTTRFSRVKGRFQIILVDENLGLRLATVNVLNSYEIVRNSGYFYALYGNETYEKEIYEMGYLISETTKEEREAIVAESLGNIEATCDGCMSGLAEMYQDYIDGKKELREINMEFNARYVHGEDMPGRSGCGYK